MPIDLIQKSLHIDLPEKAAYLAKHRALPFRKLEDAERDAAMTGLLYRVSVITGCPIPTEPIELQVLENELVAVFSENAAYSSLNIEEVALAFRMNATGESSRNGEKVKHYKDIFNLEYLADVLRRYLDIRGSLEAKLEVEEMRLLLPARTELTAEQNERETRDMIEWHYAMFLHDELLDHFILDIEYDLLSKEELLQLDAEEKYRLLDLGKERRLLFLKDSIRSKSDLTYFNIVCADFEKDKASPEEYAAIVREAKRMAVWSLFVDFKSDGREKVFK